MKKKLVLIIVSIIVVAAVAVSIAVLLINRGRQASEEDEFLPGASQVDVSKLKDAKLTIYFEANSNNAMTEVLEAVNEKLHSELKTELEFEMIWDYPENYYAKVKGDIAAGKPCDAFFYASSFPVSLGALAKEGLAADLTKEFPRYAPDYFGKFSGDELAAIMTNGKIYAIPYRIPTAERKCVIVRNDLMAKYNIPEIKSYDDYEVYLAAIKRMNPI